MKTQEKGVKMFKISNNDTRPTSLMSLLLTLNIFYRSCVSSVDF